MIKQIVKFFFDVELKAAEHNLNAEIQEVSVISANSASQSDDEHWKSGRQVAKDMSSSDGEIVFTGYAIENVIDDH